MKVLLRKLAERLQQLPPARITVIGLCCALALGVPDSFTPGPMSLVVLHMLVVLFVGWGAGKWPAVAVSGVAVATMGTVQWALHRNSLPPGWVFLWNNTMRFVVLSVAGWLTAEVRGLTRDLSRRVEERTAQWRAEAERHKATSARLSEALERFEQVINNISQVFWLTDLAKKEMVYVSPGYERIWGRTCEALYREPQSWIEAVHPDDREEVRRRSQTDQAGGRYEAEYRVIRPDGSVRWIRDRAFPVRDEQGEICRVAGLAEDITERKKTWEVLQTQAAILENMDEGVVVTDENGLVVQMNAAAERIWGYLSSEVLGRPASMFSALPEPEATQVMRDILAALQAGGSWRGTFNNRRKDGALISCEADIRRLELQGRVLMVAVEKDVTERQRVLEQLQMQARALEAMAEAVLVTDEAGAILLTNPALNATFGYEPGELLGKSMRVLSGLSVEKHDRAFLTAVEQVKRSGVFIGDYIARRKDGTLIEVETRSRGLTIGGQFFLIVVGADVTERKRAEAALRQSEEALRVFLDALPAPAFLADREGTILSSNPALGRSLGVAAERLPGKCVFDLIPPPMAGSRKAMFDQVVHTRQSVRFEDARAGRYFMNSASPVLDAAGNVTRVAALALDITESKQAERALAKQEALYRTLFELCPDGILLEDTNGNILDANQALCQSSGYSRDELLRLNVRSFTPPENQAEVGAHLATLQAGRTLEHEVLNVRKNGERCIMWLSEKLLTLPDGRQGVLVVARDITQNKRAEMAKEAFTSLGTQLGAVRTPVEAAKAVYAAADQFWSWDSATLSLYSQESDHMQPVLFYDLIAGERREVAPAPPEGVPTSRMRRIMRDGAQLMLRREGDAAEADVVRFGDPSRLSASIMVVPIRRDGQPVGVLSIQSYTPDAYSGEDLRTLQALADYCGGALERIRAEQALLRREALTRNIVAAAMDGFYVLDFAADPAGAIIEVNEAFCQMTGYRREELLQMRMADLEAQESPEMVAEHKVRIAAAGAERFETRHRRKDGQEIYVEIAVSTFADESERNFGFAREITERKRAELTREAFLTLGTKLSAAPTPVAAARAVYAAADQLWRWDAATLDLYSPERDWMEPVLFYDVIDGRRREIPPAGHEGGSPGRSGRVMRDGAELILRQPAETLETEFVRFGDPSHLSASLMYVPLRREGQPIGVLSLQSYTYNAFTRQDLQTLQALADHCAGALERIRIEAELREAHDQLEVRVQERTAELQAANEALAANEARLELALDASNAGTWSLDVTSHVSRWDDRYHALYGFESHEPMAFDAWIGRVHPEDRAGLLARIQALQEAGGGEMWNEEFRALHPVKGERWMAGLGRIERDPAGRAVRLAGINLDITERKQAEEALRQAHEKLEDRVRERTAELRAANAALGESEERYRSLINNLNVGVYRNLPGPDGGFIQANPALARMHGYDSVEEFQQVRVADLYEDPAEREVYLADLLRQGALNNYELRLKKKDGTVIYGSVSATAHHGPDGRIDWIDGVLEDITQRKRVEQNLAEALEFNRQVVSASSVGIAVYKASGQCVMANNALALIAGGTAEQLLQQDFRRLQSWHNDGLLAKAEATLKTRQPQLLECHSRTSFGRELTISARFSSFVTQGELHLLLLLTDETASRRAQEALKQSERLQKAILDNIPDPVWLKDAEGRFLAINEALAQLYGQPAESIVGKTVFDWDRPEAARLDADDKRVMESRQPITIEAALTDAKGRVRWYESIKSPIFDEQGKVTGTSGVSRDITERKRTEEALKLQSLVLQNMAEGVLLVGPDQTIRVANPALESTFGYQPGELVGRSVSILNGWPEGETARFNNRVMRATEQDGLWVGEYQNRRKDGTVFTSEARVRRIDLGGEIHFVSVQQDITERKRAAFLLQAQRDLGVSLSLTSDMHAALTRFLEIAVQMGGVDCGGIYLPDRATGGMTLVSHRGVSISFAQAAARWTANSVQMKLLSHGQSTFTSYEKMGIPPNTTRRREGLRAIALLPLSHERRIVGALVLASHTSGEIPLQMQVVIESIAAQAAGAIARILAETERHRLERQILEISDREQARIGQDIHDGLCQHLVTLAFDANSLERALSLEERPQATTARRFAELLDQTITESRQLARGLFPVRLEAEGLASALEELANATRSRFHIQCRFRSRGAVAVQNITLATHLYRIAQEAVTNAVRHSQARAVSISLTALKEGLELKIKDDGRGIGSDAPKGLAGMGLHIMEYRARSVGGRLRITSGERGGTTVCCCMRGKLK